MAGRGRKPIPRAFRVVQGTAPAKADAGEVVPKVKIPEPPEYLTQDQQNVFAEMARKLARLGVMAEEYTDAIAMYAEAWCEWRDAVDKVRETGLIFRTQSGYVQPNPYVAIKNKAWDRCLKLLSEFGLTASSSTKLRK